MRDVLGEMNLSDALVSVLHEARVWPVHRPAVPVGGKHQEFSKVHLCLSDLFGFLQEVQLAKIGVTVL